MHLRRGFLAVAAAALVLGAASGAQATYTYTVGVTPGTSPTFMTTASGTTINVTLQPGSSGSPLSGTNGINLIQNVHLTATGTTPIPTGNYNYSLDIAITNTDVAGTNTGHFTVTGTLKDDGAGINASTGVLTNTFLTDTPVSLTIGATLFTIPFNSLTYSVPTVNGTDGAIGALVTAAIPEPTSLTLLGTGALGFLGYLRRRKTA
jgi:hypothetical protein